MHGFFPSIIDLVDYLVAVGGGRERYPLQLVEKTDPDIMVFNIINKILHMNSFMRFTFLNSVKLKKFLLPLAFCLLSIFFYSKQSWEKTMDCYSPGQGLMPASFKVRTIPLDNDESATEDVLDPDFGEAAIGRVAPVDSGDFW